MFTPHRKHITSPIQAQQVNAIYRIVTMVYQYNYTILAIIHRLAFYLKHTMYNVLTSQETHYVSSTSQTG
jgi:hypothetical protein